MTPAQREWQDALRACTMLLKEARQERDEYRFKYTQAVKELRQKRARLDYYTRKKSAPKSRAEQRLPMVLAVLRLRQPLTFEQISDLLRLHKDTVKRAVELGVDTQMIREIKSGARNKPSLFLLGDEGGEDERR